METQTLGVLTDLLIIFAAGKLAGELFERMRQPAVIGELIAGIIIGPGVFGLVHPDATVATVSTMGVIVLMFAVGLETRPADLLKVGRRAFFVGALGVIVPLACGFLYALTLGNGTPEALFIGTALVATSVGITARVLADRGLVSTMMARVILAAAVIDDVLGMLVMAVSIGLGAGQVDVVSLAVLLLEVAIFVGVSIFVAPRLVARHAHLLDKLRIPNAGLIVVLVVMLGMAALSETIGLAGIVGGFFAGMIFAETGDNWELNRQVRPLYEWLVPYFFVVSGMQLQPALFADASVLLPGLVLVAIAVATKILGCGLGALGLGWRSMVAIGIGMVPRGEVGLIVAATGLSMGVLSTSSYAMIIMVVVVSTLAVPPLLARAFPWAMGALPRKAPTPGHESALSAPAAVYAED